MKQDEKIKHKGEIIPSTPSQFCKWEEEVLNKIEDRDILLEIIPQRKTLCNKLGLNTEKEYGFVKIV